MANDLKPPVSAYFDAIDPHGSDSVGALFSDEALIHDENVDHRGRAAIRDWTQDTYDRYSVQLTPSVVVADGDAVVVTSGVSGTFPGSPIELPSGLWSKAAASANSRSADHSALTKLSSTFLRPAFSKSISSLLPSIAAMVP